MSVPANLEQTKGNRIGTTTLFHVHHTNFGEDQGVYDELYQIGFRAFQVPCADRSDDWLRSFKQWGADQQEQVHLHTIGFFVNTGPSPECPVSDDPDRVKRAKDTLQKHLAKAAICESRSHFGPYPSGLLAGHYPWTQAHDERCVRFLEWAEKTAAKAGMMIEMEALNRFEAGVSSLFELSGLFEMAGLMPHIKMGPDTFHQSMGEKDTVAAWLEYDNLFGKLGHLSDSGRQIIGDEQALTKTGIFRYLASGECSIKTWSIEAFGSDTDPGIAGALGVRRLPRITGVEVMRRSFNRVVAEFAKCS